MQRAVRSAVSWLTTLLLVLLMVAIGVGVWTLRSGSWQAHPVLSGSMQPTLGIGSIAVVQGVPTESLRPGDVITFREPGKPEHLVTHRITSVQEKNGRVVYETKGDANQVKDPWQVTLRGDTSYRLVREIPYLGYATVWLRQPDTRRWFNAAAGVLGLWAVVQLFLPERGLRRRRKASVTAPVQARLGHTEVEP